MKPLDLLRRWLGESAQLRETRADLHRTFGLLVSARAERDAARDLLRAADDAVRRAHEPAVGDCDKIRLRDSDEAAAYAVHVEQDLCLPAGAFTVYPCRTCPRHPLSGDRFWHIANADPGKRTSNPVARKAERAARARRHAQNGQLVRQRISPEVIARLRGRPSL